MFVTVVDVVDHALWCYGVVVATVAGVVIAGVGGDVVVAGVVGGIGCGGSDGGVGSVVLVGIIVDGHSSTHGPEMLHSLHNSNIFTHSSIRQVALRPRFRRRN